MTIRRLGLGLALGLVVACGDERPARMATLQETLPTLLLPPSPTFVSKSGSADALQITVRTPMEPDKVGDYYRKLLKAGGWTLASDARDRDGATVLLAQHQGPPLWVRIQPATGSSGSLVQLTGAVLSRADSSRLAIAKAAYARADSIARGQLSNKPRPAATHDSAKAAPR